MSELLCCLSLSESEDYSRFQDICRVRPMNMTTFEPKSEHYKLLMLIGQGEFSGATISMAKHLPSNSVIAVRVINLDICQLPFSLVQHEIEMHRILRHRNIMPSFLSFTNNNQVWTLLPCAAYGSCRDLLHAHFKAGLPELAIAYIIRDVLQALIYLHSRAIIHRCIRSSHILVDSSGTAYLSGLRHCYSMVRNGVRLKAVHDFPDFYHTNLNWASRELLEQNRSGYNTKSDIYSLGITVCEMTNGIVPFQDMPFTQMLLSKIEGKTPRLFDINTIPELKEQQLNLSEAERQNDISVMYMRDFSQNFHDFASCCLDYEPKARLAAHELIVHPFIKQLSQKNVKLPTLPQLLLPLHPVTEHSAGQVSPECEKDVSSRLQEVTLEADWSF